MSQFAFLQSEFPEEFAMAEWAERHVLSDPGPAVIYARKALESGVKWMFAYDGRRAGHLKTANGSGSKRSDPVTKLSRGQSPEIGSRAGEELRRNAKKRTGFSNVIGHL